MKSLTETTELFLEQALEALAKGVSISDVLKNYPQQTRAEMESMLKLSMSLFALPKKTPPAPAMQRKYALMSVPSFWLSLFRLYKFAATSTAVILLITGLIGTGYVATKSLPGETLFGLKKSTEQLRIKFVLNPTTKANLQLEISQKRLNEVEQIFKSSDEPQKTRAAFNELISQTKTTVKSVQKVTQGLNDPKTTVSIVNNLESITIEQNTLISEANQDNIFPTETLVAAEETLKQVAQIKHYMEIASQERNLVNLNPLTSSTLPSLLSPQNSLQTESNKKNNVSSTATNESNFITNEDLKFTETATTHPRTELQINIFFEDPAPQFKP